MRPQDHRACTYKLLVGRHGPVLGSDGEPVEGLVLVMLSNRRGSGVYATFARTPEAGHIAGRGDWSPDNRFITVHVQHGRSVELEALGVDWTKTLRVWKGE